VVSNLKSSAAMQPKAREAGRRMPTILIGVQDTCNYFASLATGFRELGCRAYFLDISTIGLAVPDEQTLPTILRFFRSSRRKFNLTRDLPRWSPWRYLATARALTAQGLLFLWMAFCVDAAIFKSGQSYSSGALDVRLLRLLGRRIIFFYVGSDSRPLYLAGVDPNSVAMDVVFRRVNEAHDALRRAEALVDVVVANPLSAQFHRSPICIAQILGNTLDPKNIKSAKASEPRRRSEEENQARPLRVVHAPSLAALKGTDRIRAAVESMIDKGNAVDYIEISGRPNHEVLALLTTADLVIDELFSDSYGGMLAHEACALGIPVLVCGYGAAELQRLLPVEAQVPSIFGTPDEFPALLERALLDRDFRAAVAAATEGYSERTTARSVAERFLAVVEDRAPASWYTDPAQLRYVEGVAGPAENVAAIVRAYIARFGIPALRLDHNPALRDRLVAFAYKNISRPALDQLSA
jgi:hypothetical protein